MAEKDEDNSFQSKICDFLKMKRGYKTVSYCKDITGGIINKSGLFKLDNREVFIKFAQRENAYGMFTSEYESLKLIQKTETIKTPTPQEVFKIPTDGACFLLDFMEGLQPVATLWESLGEQLASLHKYNIDQLQKEETSESNIHNREATYKPEKNFGFHMPIYNGPKFQVLPGWETDWAAYYTRMKLEPQFAEIELKKGDPQFRELWSELQRLIDVPFRDIIVQPSIVHGDFCTINVGEYQGEPVLYDPGCYYGHSETDFTIPSIEGNFPEEFYKGYHRILPKQKYFDARQKLYQLFGYTLMYNCLNEDEMGQAALQTGRDLLNLIKK